MNIGFDLDKVFIDYPPFVPDSLINFLYKKRNKNILLYRMPKKPEQFIRTLSHHSAFRPIIKTNLEIIKKNRKKRNNKHFLISSRFSFLEKKTNLLIKRHSFNNLFDEMFFNYKNEQPHIFKEKVIKKLRLNRYIDDDFHLLNYLSQKYTRCTYYWLNSKIEKKISKNLVAVKRFEEVFK